MGLGNACAIQMPGKGLEHFHSAFSACRYPYGIDRLGSQRWIAYPLFSLLFSLYLEREVERFAVSLHSLRSFDPRRVT